MKKVFVLTVMLVCIVAQGFAQQSEIFIKNKTAIDGYDVVAFFTDSQALKGKPEFSIYWKDAQWLFSSKQNLDLFSKDPGKYAPQYGGYCAFGVSRGYKAPTIAEAWSVVNGKLYFNYNLDVRQTWNKDQQQFINKADMNWQQFKHAAKQ